jgi:hypothetical protein
MQLLFYLRKFELENAKKVEVFILKLTSIRCLYKNIFHIFYFFIWNGMNQSFGCRYGSM